jgi:hypothetical protein
MDGAFAAGGGKRGFQEVHEMKFYGIDNLVSQTARVSEPWTFANRAIEGFSDKDAFLEFRKRPGTKHLHYSAFEGLDPLLRVTESNKAVVMHGVVADYDATITNEERAAVLDKVKVEFRPQWVSRTFSSGARLIWAFEEPVCLPSNEAAKAFLKLFRKKMKVSSIFPGLDEEALCNPATYYEVGTDWVRLSEDVIPRNLVWQWMAQSGEELRWDKQYTAIPVDKVAEEVARQFPGRWQGPFELGARGLRFWDPTGDNETAAVVRESGMQCFTGPSAFVPWGAILGNRFVEQYEADRLGAVIASLWFDGREYWRQGDGGRFQSLGREDMRLWLKSKHGLNACVPRGESCSEVDHALRMVQENKRIICAAPVVLKPTGLIRVNGQAVLNVSTVQVIEPAPGPVSWGEGFPWLAAFLDSFLEPKEQLEFLLAGLKRFYETGWRRNLLPGQVTFLCGEREQGKNLYSNVIVSKMVGGHVDAADYLTGQTKFSGSFFEMPLWTMDDVTPLADAAKHRHYTALLKKMVANRIFSADEKFKKVQTVEWCGRIIVTTNLDPESIRILPALDVSNQDKVSLFRVRTMDRKFPADVVEIITGELPYLARWLLDWKMPEHVLGSVRYGVKSYIEESLLAEARQSSDTAQFEELLGAFLKQLPEGTKEWVGTSTDLMAQLAGVEGFGPLLRDITPSRIGRLLAKLEASGYLRFERNMTARVWRVDIEKFWGREGTNDVPF